MRAHEGNKSVFRAPLDECVSYMADKRNMRSFATMLFLSMPSFFSASCFVSTRASTNAPLGFFPGSEP